MLLVNSMWGLSLNWLKLNLFPHYSLLISFNSLEGTSQSILSIQNGRCPEPGRHERKKQSFSVLPLKAGHLHGKPTDARNTSTQLQMHHFILQDTEHNSLAEYAQRNMAISPTTSHKAGQTSTTTGLTLCAPCARYYATCFPCRSHLNPPDNTMLCAW